MKSTTDQLITVEFNARPIHFTGEAFVNLTEMGAAYGKQPAQFLRLPSTRRFIDALKEILMCENHTSNGDPGAGFDAQYLSIKRVVFSSKTRGQAGTWAHPDLAVEFARWCDAKFSIWCNRTIRKILSGELVALGNGKDLPPNIRAALSPKRLARFERMLAACQELLPFHNDGKRCFCRRMAEIAAKYGMSHRTLRRWFYLWVNKNFDSCVLVPFAGLHEKGGGELASIYKRETSQLSPAAPLHLCDS